MLRFMSIVPNGYFFLIRREYDIPERRCSLRQARTKLRQTITGGGTGWFWLVTGLCTVDTVDLPRQPVAEFLWNYMQYCITYHTKLFPAQNKTTSDLQTVVTEMELGGSKFWVRKIQISGKCPTAKTNYRSHIVHSAHKQTADWRQLLGRESHSNQHTSKTLT